MTGRKQPYEPRCHWCGEPLPARDPDRYGAVGGDDYVEDDRGFRSPLPVRVCRPTCPERPEGFRVVRIGNLGVS